MPDTPVGRGNPLWLPGARAGTATCPYGIMPDTPVGRGNPLWLPGARAGTATCPYGIMPDTPVGRGNPCVCPAPGQARGPAPTTSCPIRRYVGATPCGCPAPGQARGPAPTERAIRDKVAMPSEGCDVRPDSVPAGCGARCGLQVRGSRLRLARSGLGRPLAEEPCRQDCGGEQRDRVHEEHLS